MTLNTKHAKQSSFVMISSCPPGSSWSPFVLDGKWLMNMWRVTRLTLVVLLASISALAAQQAPVNLDAMGPRVGAAAPTFSGIDQFGRTQTLGSVSGEQGVMLVFFRSADW